MVSFYEELRKSDTISDEKENVQSRASIDKWIFRLLLFLLGFMPIVVMAHVEEVTSPIVSNIDVLSSGIKGELFTHYKAMLVLIITVIAGALLLIKVLFMDGTIRKTYLNYIFGLFVAIIVVSTMFSPNISIALNGQYNRSDGAISWICYIALLFIAMNIEYPKNVIRYIMYTMMPFVIINIYIITMNFYGMDLLQNSWMQKLVSILLPEGANISEGSKLVGTLNQWNYMSGMFAMMTIMYLAWAVTSKNWYEILVGTITSVISMAIVFMSISTSGFLTVLTLFVIIIVTTLFVEKKVKAMIPVLLFCVIIIPIFHVLSEKDYRVWTESIGFFTDKNPYNKENITLSKLGNIAYASDVAFELPILPERMYAPGSGRTYIWGKTVDLVKDRALIGYGSDTLIYNFPHNNIDSRSGMWDENIITDKPHSGYIGVLYGFGVLGLIVLLILVITIVKNTLKSIFTKSWSVFILAITSLAYFIQAIFNDSLPSTSSIAFILVGVVLSMTLNNSEENFLDGRIS